MKTTDRQDLARDIVRIGTLVSLATLATVVGLLAQTAERDAVDRDALDGASTMVARSSDDGARVDIGNIRSGTVDARAIDRRGSMAGSDGARAAFEGDADAEIRLAVLLEREAGRLHPRMERWTDAAILHLFAAHLRHAGRTATNRRAELTDLLVSAGLFHHVGDVARACAALARAGDVAAEAGRPATADFAGRIAARLASVAPGCAEGWAEALDGLVIPRPEMPVAARPEFGAIVRDELRIERVELEAPAAEALLPPVE